MFPGLKWVQIGGGALAGFALCWLIHMVILAGVNEAHTKALKDQKEKLEQSCADDKAITERGQNALQLNYDQVARDLAEHKRMRPAHCIVPTPKPPSAPAGGAEYAGANGISTEWLQDFAAECERYRQERITLENFEKEVWDGQAKK